MAQQALMAAWCCCCPAMPARCSVTLTQQQAEDSISCAGTSQDLGVLWRCFMLSAMPMVGRTFHQISREKASMVTVHCLEH